MRNMFGAFIKGSGIVWVCGKYYKRGIITCNVFAKLFGKILEEYWEKTLTIVLAGLYQTGSLEKIARMDARKRLKLGVWMN